MFNGHKPHHPQIRFFLYFAERRGRGCCCAWADKKEKSGVGLAVFALRPAQRPLGLLGSLVGGRHRVLIGISLSHRYRYLDLSQV